MYSKEQVLPLNMKKLHFWLLLSLTHTHTHTHSATHPIKMWMSATTHTLSKYWNRPSAPVYTTTLHLDYRRTENVLRDDVYMCTLLGLQCEALTRQNNDTILGLGKGRERLYCSGHLRVRVSAHTPSSAPQRGWGRHGAQLQGLPVYRRNEARGNARPCRQWNAPEI